MNSLLTISFLISLMFLLMKHPLSMGLMLLIQTLTVSMITGNLNINFWYSYIMFLIMIGGMLILFMYMTSVASNEKFKSPSKIIMLLTILSPLPIYLIDWSANLMQTNQQMSSLEKSNLINYSFNKFMMFPLLMTMIMVISYLFITLIATAKITQFKQGPLRQMN